MSSRRNIWTMVAIAFLFTGCAADQAEFKSLREQVRLQQKQIVDLKARQEEGQTKLEILDNGFRILGDKVEENALRLDDMGTLSSAPLSAVPVLSAAPAPPSRPRPAPAPAPAPRVERIVVAPPLSAADLYRSALDKFTQENYQSAILEFEEFVANHSSHDLADNAQYWIGECYYAEKNFELAVVEFDKVDKHFSGGNKVSAALLKKGLALRELGRNAEAAATLERVVSQFPQSDEAAMAERKLSQWR
jgi:tol-pal system protein YbgF